MKTINTRAFVGILGLAVAGLASIGCGSSGGGSGTGGTSGGGGSSGGGSSGCAAATSASIDDFGSGTQAAGTPYLGAQTGLTAPTVSTSSGAMVITLATGAPTMMYPYAYVGLPLNACTSAAAYTGVKFNIGGTLSAGCTIQFSAVDKEHSTMANNGTCTAANCYASAFVFPLPASPSDVTVKFADQTGGGADPGAAVVDPSQLLNVQWQVNVPTDGCTGTVTIDNVVFN